MDKMEKRRCILWHVVLVLIMMTGYSAHTAETPLLPRATICQPQAASLLTKSDSKDSEALDIIQKAQIGIPVAGRHEVEQQTTSAQQHICQRWNNRIHRLLCVICTRQLNHQYKLTCLTCQHLFTLRYSQGEDIYGRCQMRC